MTVHLRPYQEAAVKAIKMDWTLGVRDTLCVLPTGTGKCLGADESVFLADGRVLPASDLVRQTVEVIGVEDTTSMRQTATRATFTDNGERDIYEIELDNGIVLRRTAEHPLWSATLYGYQKVGVKPNGKLIERTRARQSGWRAASELLPCGTRPDFGGHVVLCPLALNQIGTDRRPEHEVILCAALLAEGCMTGSCVEYSNADDAMVNLVASACAKVGCDLVRDEPTRYDYRIVCSQRWQRNPVNRMVKDWGLVHKATEKSTPSWVFNLPTDQIALFLRVFVDSDGWVDDRGHISRVNVSLANPILVRQIAQLALRLGITGTLTHKENDHTGAWTWSTSMVDEWIYRVGSVFKGEKLQHASASQIAARTATTIRNREWRRARSAGAFADCPPGYEWRKVVAVCRSRGPTVSIEVHSNNHAFLGYAVEHNTQVFLSVTADVLRMTAARVLILAHTEELVTQPLDRLDQFWPDLSFDAGIVQGSRDDGDRRIVIATVQSLGEKRLARILAHGPFTHLVVDECHHAVAPTYRRVYDQVAYANPELRHVGVTATPIRADKKGLCDVYKKVAFKYTIKEAIRDGWLSPIKAIGVETGISLDSISFRDGEYSQDGIATVYDVANCHELVVESWKRWAQERLTIGFFASVEAAHHAADAFSKAGIPAAACDGDTPKDLRRDILRDFKAGRIRVLTNMNLFTEGVDVPEVACILWCAPTGSQGRYTQGVGRGLRKAPGKDDCLVIDFLPSDTKRIVTAGDVLGRPRQERQAVERATERGVVIDAFMDDGKHGAGIDADPDELVAKKLDLLGRNRFIWYFADGWSTLGLGDAARDGQDKTLAIVKVGDAYRLVLDARVNVGDATKDPDTGHYKKLARVTSVLAEGGYEDVLDRANDYADDNAADWLAKKGREWNREPASAKQVDLLVRFDKMAPGELAKLTRLQAAQRITYWMVRRNTERRGLHIARADIEAEVW